MDLITDVQEIGENLKRPMETEGENLKRPMEAEGENFKRPMETDTHGLEFTEDKVCSKCQVMTLDYVDDFK